MTKRLELTGQEFGRLVAKKPIKINGLCMWACECVCGNKTNVRTGALISGGTKSCGCLQSEEVSTRMRKDLAGQRFGRLVVKKFAGKNRHRNALWLCECTCGNVRTIIGSHLISGATKSCGCYRRERIIQSRTKDVSGQRFGLLVALESIGKDKLNRTLWKCVCDCGKTKNVPIRSLMCGDVSTCGNCKNYVNGKRVSYPQREIAKMINGELNHITESGYCIDIAFPDKMIGIEYDSWFWHSHNLDRDKKKTIDLNSLGWHILRILSNELIPDKAVLLKEMAQLENEMSRELVLRDWKTGKTAKDVYRSIK